MTDRYGNTRVAKIKAAYNDLRAAIRSGDIEAAERALDRYEPWADYVFGAPKVKPLVWEAEDGSPACQDANGCGKLYRVIVSHDGTAVLRHNASLCDQETHGSEEAAKAAAQADYERRILSALEGYDD